METTWYNMLKTKVFGEVNNSQKEKYPNRYKTNLNTIMNKLICLFFINRDQLRLVDEDVVTVILI